MDSNESRRTCRNKWRSQNPHWYHCRHYCRNDRRWLAAGRRRKDFNSRRNFPQFAEDDCRPARHAFNGRCITGLGDIRNLGPIGGRTVLYYMATTGISVLIGIILVNVIQPGKDISHGEERPELAYTLSGDGDRTVNLTNGTWERTRYSEKYMLMLSDQQVEGEIESFSEESATVKSWKNKAEGVFHIATDSGEHLPFRRVNGEVVSAEPELLQNGTGLQVKLPVAQKLRGKEKRDMGGTLKEVLLGDKSTGKEGYDSTQCLQCNGANGYLAPDILLATDWRHAFSSRRAGATRHICYFRLE